MEARAVLRYARISPRKVKIVLDLIRNKPANVAMGILRCRMLRNTRSYFKENSASCSRQSVQDFKENQPYHFSIKGNGRLIEKEVHSWDKKLIHTDLESEL